MKNYTNRLTVDKFYLEQLKKQVYLQAGFEIRSKADCLVLANQINTLGIGTLSVSTIYRLFINSGSHQPFRETLNILSRFVGKETWDQFIVFLSESHGSLFFESPDAFNSLLLFCIKYESYDVLDAYFAITNQLSDENRFSIALQLFDCMCLLDNNENFFKRFAGNTFIRQYFFERLFDPAFRIPQYAQGFLQYQSHIDFEKSLNEAESYIFSSLVLFRYYFIKSDKPEFTRYGKLLYEDKRLEELLNNIHVFPYSRYLMYKMIYLSYGSNNNILHKYILYVLDTIDVRFSYCDALDVRIILFNLIDTLDILGKLEQYEAEISKLTSRYFEKLPKGFTLDRSFIYSPKFDPNTLMIYRPVK